MTYDHGLIDSIGIHKRKTQYISDAREERERKQGNHCDLFACICRSVTLRPMSLQFTASLLMPNAIRLMASMPALKTYGKGKWGIISGCFHESVYQCKGQHMIIR